MDQKVVPFHIHVGGPYESSGMPPSQPRYAVGMPCGLGDYPTAKTLQEFFGGFGRLFPSRPRFFLIFGQSPQWSAVLWPAWGLEFRAQGLWLRQGLGFRARGSLQVDAVPECMENQMQKNWKLSLHGGFRD